MGFLSVIIAAAATYAFGAAWYMALGKRWMVAAGLEMGADGRPANNNGATPFIISAIAMIIVAGMMRHVFAMAGIDTVGKGLMAGLGTGLFIVLPWVVTNYAYAMRPKNLSLIDGGYAVFGCTIMGIVLTLF